MPKYLMSVVRKGELVLGRSSSLSDLFCGPWLIVSYERSFGNHSNLC